jgi:hypothetical protein
MKDHRIASSCVRRTLTSIALLASLATLSQAGIVNGNFDNDLDPWELNGSVIWTADGPAPNGYARLNGSGSIWQNGWQCGDHAEDDMDCLVTFRYRSNNDAMTPTLKVTFGDAGKVGTEHTFNGTGGVWMLGAVLSPGCTTKDILFDQLGFALEIDDIKDTCIAVVAPAPGAALAMGLGLAGNLRRTRKRQ